MSCFGPSVIGCFAQDGRSRHSRWRSWGCQMKDAAEKIGESAATPDQHARGLLQAQPDALRYDDPSEDPDETPALVRRLIPHGAKVLDVGCGTGSLTLAATRGCGARVLGIEPDARRAAMAQSRGLEVICGTADR